CRAWEFLPFSRSCLGDTYSGGIPIFYPSPSPPCSRITHGDLGQPSVCGRSRHATAPGAPRAGGRLRRLNPCPDRPGSPGLSALFTEIGEPRNFAAVVRHRLLKHGPGPDPQVALAGAVDDQFLLGLAVP